MARGRLSAADEIEKLDRLKKEGSISNDEFALMMLRGAMSDGDNSCARQFLSERFQR